MFRFISLNVYKNSIRYELRVETQTNSARKQNYLDVISKTVRMSNIKHLVSIVQWNSHFIRV